jgi:hypothetical protein
MRSKANNLMIICFLFILSCAPSRFVKPLQKKEKVASFSFGGPLILYGGAAIPIPFSTLAYGYGLTDKCTLYGSLHTTSLLFGNIQSDVGSTFLIYQKEKKFGLSVSPALQIATALESAGTFRIWPSTDINWYWHPKEKQSYLYAGVGSWFELSKTKAHDQKQQRAFVPNLQLGYTVKKEKWDHQFEFKFLGVGINNLPGVVSYVGAGKQGSFGIYYSLIRKF